MCGVCVWGGGRGRGSVCVCDVCGLERARGVCGVRVCVCVCDVGVGRGKGVKEDSRRVRVHMFLRGRVDTTVSVRD